MHNFKNTLSKNLTMRQIDRWIDGWIDRQTNQPISRELCWMKKAIPKRLHTTYMTPFK